MNIVSVHFPKAGGHALLVQLRYLLRDSLLEDYSHDPLGPNAGELVDDLPLGIRMVHGHFRAARYDKVKNAFRFTFLRHPVDNLLSQYFFWQTYPDADVHSLHAKFLRERPTIEKFAGSAPIRRLMSEMYFGGYDMARFDLVGFIETRSADYRKLNQVAGLPLDPDIRLNETATHHEERAAIKSDALLMSRISALLSDDIRFYQRQRAIWS